MHRMRVMKCFVALRFVRLRWCRPAVIVLLLLPVAGLAASFDCTKPISPMEKAICSDKTLSDADSAMAEAYRRTLQLLPVDAAGKLRGDQRQWLEALERGCQVAQIEVAGADGKPVDAADGSPEAQANLQRMAGCMKGAYDDRIDTLKHAYAKVGDTVFLTRSVLLLAADAGEYKDAIAGVEVFSGFGSLTVNWPEAQSTDPRWLAWNAALVRKVQTRIASEKEVAEKPGWHSSIAEGFDGSFFTLTPRVSQGRVSVDMELSYMGHTAPHPNEVYLTWNWMLDAGREMKTQDVFRPGTAWRQTLAAYAWKDLRTGQGSDMLYDAAHGARSKVLLEAVGNVENWIVTPEGLQLSWPEYALAPRAAALGDMLVPWHEVQTMLVPGFVP